MNPSPVKCFSNTRRMHCRFNLKAAGSCQTQVRLDPIMISASLLLELTLFYTRMATTDRALLRSRLCNPMSLLLLDMMNLLFMITRLLGGSSRYVSLIRPYRCA